MIDEKKLIEEIYARLEEIYARHDFWINKSAKCIEIGTIDKCREMKKRNREK